MKKLLFIGDAPSVNTGFGTVSRNILTRLQGFDIAILGINYYGDPHPMQSQFRMYPPILGNKGDVYGYERLRDVIVKEQPDVIMILNDVWMVAEYILAIRKVAKNVPIIVYTPIDSDHIQEKFVAPLKNNVAALCTYTNYGVKELQTSGYTDPITVIPHGVDRGVFTPIDKAVARKEAYAGTPLESIDPFVVLYVARNSPRKRVDLWIYTISEWIKRYNRKNVYMHYHGSAKDVGYDVEDLAHYYGVDDRLILTAKTLNPSVGVPLEKLNYVYNCADIYFHGCAVAGWEMPVAEAMQCKVPTLVPDYSALGEWPRYAPYDTTEYIKIDPKPWHNPGGINTVHYFYDVDHAIEKLEYLYQNKSRRDELSENGYKLMQDKRFSWNVITKQFQEVLTDALRWKPKVPKVQNNATNLQWNVAGNTEVWKK